MACTVAVEALVTRHYDDQVKELDLHFNNASGERLDADHRELVRIIRKFRDDEQAHHDAGLAHGAEEAPAYAALTAIIGFGCRWAIFLSERI